MATIEYYYYYELLLLIIFLFSFPSLQLLLFLLLLLLTTVIVTSIIISTVVVVVVVVLNPAKVAATYGKVDVKVDSGFKWIEMGSTITLYFYYKKPTFNVKSLFGAKMHIVYPCK